MVGLLKGLGVQHHWSSHGEKAAEDMATAGAVMAELNKHYPGHQWYVEANAEAGVVTIKLLYEAVRGRTSSWGCLIHLTTMANISWQKKVMMVGGELLERWNLKRGAYREGDKLRAKENGIITNNAILKSRDNRWH